jgi:lipopolysaccharide/colanic/teichoic acid biosynthesis glycosyltransferase
VASIKQGIPRSIEALLAFAGLIALSPFLCVAALAVALSSPGSVLYRQERVGLQGKKFLLYKFRSMRAQSAQTEKGSQHDLQITAWGDPRVTRVGRFLRMTKIDELPELWNVLKGDMSFVGPRPEVEKYVDLKNPLWTEVLTVRPGITDPVTLSLRNEEELLGRVKGSPEQFYLETLQPLKLKGYLEYLRQRSARRDVMVIVRTILVIFFPSKAPAHTAEGILPSQIKTD